MEPRNRRGRRTLGILTALTASCFGFVSGAPGAAAPAIAAGPAMVANPGAPLILDKEITSGPTGVAGLTDTYDVTYTISVRNISGQPGTYDLTDALQFGPDVTVQSAAIASTGPGTPAPQAGWNGGVATSVANDLVIADGATHAWTVSLRVTYPRSVVVDPADDCALGGGETGTGLRNLATLTPAGGTATTAVACRPIGSPWIGKSGVVVSGPNTGSSTVAQAGDVIEWKVQYQNVPESAGHGVSITDAIGVAQAYVPGSLNVPGDGPGGAADWTGTFSTVPGSLTATDYVGGAEPVTVEGVGMSHAGNGLPTALGNSTAFPAPVQSFQASAGGGDGTYAIFYANNVYNIHHHMSPGAGTLMECHDKSTGAVCAGWPAAGSYFSPVAGAALGTGTNEYLTSMAAGGEYVDPSGKLYFPVARNNVAGYANTAGIACADLALLVSCGFTPLTTTAGQYTDGAALGGNARIGTRLYPTTRRGELFCFDAATQTACPGFPVTVSPGAFATVNPATANVTDLVEAYGQYVFGATQRYDVAGAWTTAWCFDTVTNTMCPGYPMNTIGTVNQQSRYIAPITSTTGVVTGACWEMTPLANVPFQGWQCFDVNGVAQTAPAYGVPIPGAQTAGTVGFGSPLLIGTKVYLHSTVLPGTGVSTYSCYDFAIAGPCAGFTNTTSNTNMQAYTIREDPANPGCLWVVGHTGRFEVFTANSGGIGCAVTSASLTISPTSYYCQASPSHITAWDRVYLGNLAPSDYAGALLTIRDGGGTIVPGWDRVDVTADLNAQGFTSVASVPYATYPTLQFDLDLTGVDGAPFAGPTPPYVNLTWVGDPLEMCYRTLVAATCAERSLDNTAQLGYLPDGEPPRTSQASEDFAYIATDASCFDVAKSVTGRTYLGANQWEVTYQVDVDNPSLAEGRYDLTDALQPGGGIVVQPTPTVANTVPGAIVTNPSWTGTAPNVAVVTDRAITAGGHHTYGITSTVLVPPGLPPTAYNCTLDPGETGTGTLNNVSLTSDAGPPQTASACSAMVPSYTITKTSSPASTVPVVPGQVITYTLTIVNTGDVGVAPTITDDLAGVLDDADFNSATSDSGDAPTLTGTTLNWSDDLAVGQTIHLTYSVTVKDGDALGDGLIDNVVTGDPISNCGPGSSDPVCATHHPVEAVRFSKVVSTPNVTVLVPGATFTYTLTVENIGQTDLTGLTFTDSLASVLDDATYNGNVAVTSGPGAAAYSAPTITWTGNLDVGESAVVTYSVTVDGSLDGDGVLRNGIVGSGPDSNCPVGSTDPRCSVSVPGPILHTVKSASPAGPLPGDVVTYTITTTNSGTGAALNILIGDDLSDVLDDATFDPATITRTLGAAPTYSAPDLSWVGDIQPGQTQTITYQVTVKAPAALASPGDAVLVNAVTAPDCPNPAITDEGAPGFDADCVTHLPVPAYAIVKTSVPPSGSPVGTSATVSYTLTVTNTGGIALAPAISDDLTGVFDDATYNDDVTATAGIATVVGLRLDWTGPLPVDGVVTITYSVTVDDPDGLVDAQLRNAVTGDPDISNCPPGGSDPQCSTGHDVAAWDVLKSADRTTVVAGDTITYTITVTNIGRVALTGIGFDDDLGQVLDDATYGGDAAASTGTVSYAAPVLSWTGDVPIAGQAVITYSFAVHDPLDGDGTLTNLVVTPPGGPCDAPSTDPECRVDLPTRELTIVKDTVPADLASVRPGDTVRYRVTITNTGTSAYTPATVDDDLADALDAATGPNAIAVTGPGSASFDAGTQRLTWSGNLLPGQIATVDYELVVRTPLSADGLLENVVSSPDPGANCAAATLAQSAAAMPTACRTQTPVQAMRVIKQSDLAPGASVAIGAVVTYTITVSNTGQAALEPATFTDNLSGLLDDAALDGSPTASVGTVGYAAPVLSWSGHLPVGGTATVTYRVRITGGGDRALPNVVVSDGPDSNCAPGSSDPMCAVNLAVLPPTQPTTPATTTPVVDGELPATGSDTQATLRIVALLGLVGLGLVLVSRRRRTVRAA